MQSRREQPLPGHRSRRMLRSARVRLSPFLVFPSLLVHVDQTERARQQLCMCHSLLRNCNSLSTALANRSILSGLLQATSGSCRVGAFDVGSQLDQVYTILGICPQFGTLDCWHNLLGSRDLFAHYVRSLTSHNAAVLIDCLLRRHCVGRSDCARSLAVLRAAQR